MALRSDRLGERIQVVPDATLSGRHCAVRVFVELDRSTRGLARIQENVERYAWFLRHGYGDVFPDGRAPSLLYVVRSAGRRAGIAERMRSALGGSVPWAVHQEKEAVKWLEATLVDPTQDAAPPRLPAAGTDESSDALVLAARTVYRWARSYVEQLRAEGRALPPEGLEALRAMHRQLRARLHAKAGRTTTASRA